MTLKSTVLQQRQTDKWSLQSKILPPRLWTWCRTSKSRPCLPWRAWRCDWRPSCRSRACFAAGRRRLWPAPGMRCSCCLKNTSWKREGDGRGGKRTVSFQCCGTVTTFYGSCSSSGSYFWKSYGSGSGSYIILTPYSTKDFLHFFLSHFKSR